MNEVGHERLRSKIKLFPLVGEAFDGSEVKDELGRDAGRIINGGVSGLEGGGRRGVRELVVVLVIVVGICFCIFWVFFVECIVVVSGLFLVVGVLVVFSRVLSGLHRNEWVLIMGLGELLFVVKGEGVGIFRRVLEEFLGLLGVVGVIVSTVFASSRSDEKVNVDNLSRLSIGVISGIHVLHRNNAVLLGFFAFQGTVRSIVFATRKLRVTGVRRGDRLVGVVGKPIAFATREVGHRRFFGGHHPA